MRTDYKFWYIKRDDDGFITEVAVRFYEGDYIAGKYVRTQRIIPEQLLHLNKRVVTEKNGNPALVYTDFDFGRIKTDEEISKFLNIELAKDKSRTPVDSQKGI